MGRHEALSTGIGHHANSAKPQVVGTIEQQRELVRDPGKELITRRSRVQIPPPLRTKALALQGLSAFPLSLGSTAVSLHTASIPRADKFADKFALFHRSSSHTVVGGFGGVHIPNSSFTM